MKKNLRRLIPLFVACTVLFGGCTSPQKAEKQLILDLKSAASLLQFSGETMAARYRMHVSANNASLLSAQTVMTEENFQKQVKSGKEYLVKNAEILLGIQEQTLPNAIIYITSLPSLGVTQQHLDAMFENYRTANVSFSACFNKAEKSGTKTSFKELEPTLKEGQEALKKADETIQRLQSALSQFITDYNKDSGDLGWKIAMKSNLSSVEQAQASNRVLTRCFELTDLTISLSDFYSQFSRTIFSQNQANGFPSSAISENRTLLRSISQKLEEWKTSGEEVKQNADLLGLDSAAYTKVLSEMQTAVQKADAALSAMETKNASQLSSSVSAFEKAYENLSASQNELATLIHTCSKQLLDHFSNP